MCAAMWLWHQFLKPGVARSSSCAPNASATAANVVYWMGVDKFYLYDGTVKTLYCPLRQYIFGDINLQQQYQLRFGEFAAYRREVWKILCADFFARYVRPDATEPHLDSAVWSHLFAVCGNVLGQQVTALDRVGVYVPGGRDA